MRTRITGILWLMLSCLAACFSEAPADPERWIIEPSGNVGGIVPTSSLEDVIRIFGPENVQAVEIPVGEGETVQGTRVYPGSLDAFEIEWKEANRLPERITVANPGTRWKTRDGITVGSTLADVETANGTAFLLTGLDWDYPSRSVFWNNGRLDPRLQVELTVSEAAREEDLARIQGDGPFPSDDHAVKRLNLRVSRVFVRW